MALTRAYLDSAIVDARKERIGVAVWPHAVRTGPVLAAACSRARGGYDAVTTAIRLARQSVDVSFYVFS